MEQYTQDKRLIAVTTPLGKDVLLLTAFSGEEALSRLFTYQLEMLSANDAIAATDLVGKSVTWLVRGSGRPVRYFNGFVSRFAAGATQIRGLRRYRAEVVPWLWFLTRTADCRIFQKKTAPEIVQQIFKDLGFTAYESNLRGTYRKRDYCVQYRETDFHFVSRLLEEEGIFYFFRHDNGGHTLVLADQKTAYKNCLESEVEGSVAPHITGQVTSWEHRYEFRSGKWAQTDYNFETPSTSLMSRMSSVVRLPGNEKYEVYDYPGLYLKKPEGDDLTRIRMEEEEAAYDVVSGTSSCPSFTLAGKFKLKTYASASEKGKTYAITSIRHFAAEGSYTPEEDKSQDYGNSFTCIPESVTFRPPRVTAKPLIHGPQTAVVVGPSGEEIYTDKYGRIKVQFFWDREGKKDENSSCWIRLAQKWAGKNWGMVFLPRIGQEVVVEFLEGDPDRPLITGCLYNADQMPVYELPTHQTQSVLKSRSTKNGQPENFNELRFEDKKGSEDVYFHAEKDFHRVVEHDDDLKVGHDQTIDVKNNRTETVEEGDEKVTIKKGNRAVEISMGNESLTIKMGNQTTKLDMGKSETEAMQSIVLKVGQSSITLDQTGVSIKGLTVKIEGQIEVDVKAVMAQVNADAMLQLKGGITMIN
jgi:type VI secretion system secreted protein VgrG